MQIHFYRSKNPESNLENREKPERPPEALCCLKLLGGLQKKAEEWFFP